MTSTHGRMPVYLFFMIIAPQSATAAHLKILACISQMLKNQECRTRLMHAENPSEVHRIIVEADRGITTLQDALRRYPPTIVSIGVIIWACR